MGLYGVMFGKIRTQLITFYGLLILFTMLASGLVYQQINRNLAVGKLGDLSTQTASAIQYSLDSFFDNINKYSKRLIASSTVQEILQMELRESNIAQANKRLQDVVNEILIAEPAIASVFLLREDGVRFSWENR